MKIYKPPSIVSLRDLSNPTIFLAGSIEMGAAAMWQDDITNQFVDLDVTIFNPRRDDWDPSWEQDINNPVFNEQVNWELDHIEMSDIVLFHFDPNTMSPITLMEFGICTKPKLVTNLIVNCPQGFWRKGNVDIVCQRYQIQQVNGIEELAMVAKHRVLNSGERK